MYPKINNFYAEYEKNAAKITELQARQKELSKERTELENLDIIGIVRSLGVTPDALAALIQASRGGQAAPALGNILEEKEGGNDVEAEND